jgi:hypothetical protein
MKTLLHFIIACVLAVPAVAQSANTNKGNNYRQNIQRNILAPRVDVSSLSRMTEDKLSVTRNAIPRVASRRNQPGANSTQSINVTLLGSAANAYGNFYIGRTLLQYEPALNTVTLMHRTNPAASGDPNTGYYRYDKSTDGGVTWSVNNGPLYGPILNLTNTRSGRYPIGVIGNPIGNINPDNAYEVYGGEWSNLSAWNGQVWGAGKLDNSAHTEHYDSTDTNGNMVWINDIFATRQNVIWKIGAVVDDNNGPYYNYLRVYKGTFTGTDYNYTSQDLHFPVNPDLDVYPYDMNIAFSDDGMTGYAVCINNADSSYIYYPTGVMYLQMYITTDGGATWVGAASDTVPLTLDVQYIAGNAWFGNPDSTFGVQGWGAARPDFDMVVDGNGNLHIFVGVFPQSSFGESQADPGTWGLADLYTTDHGATWLGQLVAKPNTYAGNYGDPVNIQEGNRPFVSRSDDGMKLFFGWYDTDSIFGVPTNDFPDLYVTGLDIATNMWTPVTRMTEATVAEGMCTFGIGAYYVKDTNCTFTIPAAYMTVVMDVDNPCDFFYLDGVNVTCADFTIPGAPPVNILNTNCSAAFSLYPDSAVLHMYWVVNNATGAAPIQYEWNWGDGNYDTIPYPSHTYAIGGFYTICLTITDDSGCVSMNCQTMAINSQNGNGNERNTNTMVIVNVIPPIITGINATSLPETLAVYPNPFSSTISILAPGNKNAIGFRLFSMQGVEMLTGAMTGSEYNLNVEALSAGIYLLEIGNETEFKTYRKLIKK